MNNNMTTALEEMEIAYGQDFREYILNVKDEKIRELRWRSRNFETVKELYQEWLDDEYNLYLACKEEEE